MHAPYVRIARSPTVVNIQNLIDDREVLRDRPRIALARRRDLSPLRLRRRSPNRVTTTTQPERQRYQCQACQKHFDDLTGTIFAGHHQPLRVWVLCLYFMGLNLSNEQIGQELDLDPDDAQMMATQLREGIVERKPEEVLSGEVECDEVYVVAGHKGHPEAVKKRAAPPPAAVEGGAGRGTLAKEKPPIFGMIQRAGEVVIRMLENVQAGHDRPADPRDDRRRDCRVHR